MENQVLIKYNDLIGVKITKLPNGGELHEYDGNKSWYLNDGLHREDGPAIKYSNGTKAWYLNGKFHREDGPAVEYFDGPRYWYIHGKQILCKTQKEFEQYMRLKAFW